MSFITKPDFSNNRQVKQFQLSSTQLSGTTVFGVDDILIPINFTGDTINIDALQNIRTRGIILPNSLPQFTGSTYQLLGRDNTTGKVVSVPTTSGGTGVNTDDYTITANLTGTILEFTRLSGGTYDVELSGITGSNDNDNDYVVSGDFIGDTLTLNRLSGATVSITGLPTSTGLEAINEGNGIGWRLIGRNPAQYGNIGRNAVDFGVNYLNNSTLGALGDLSFNFGEDNSLTGYGSVGFGALIHSSGIDSFSIGIKHSEAGYTNTLFGIGHHVSNMNCTVVGQAAEPILHQISDFNFTPQKELFVVGNGTIQNSDPNFNVLTRSNAFVVKMNGEITAPSTEISDIDSASNKSLVTLEYFNRQFTQKNINGNYTIVEDDKHRLLVLSAATPFNITVNSGLTENFKCEFINIGPSVITYVEGTASLNDPDGTKMLPNKVAMMVHIGNTGEYWLKGELE